MALTRRGCVCGNLVPQPKTACDKIEAPTAGGRPAVPQMITARKILAELLHEATKPRPLAGFLFCCSVVATFFPLIHCPCTKFPEWLFPLSISGAVCWFGSASFMAVASESTEERIVWIAFTLAAPIAYVVVLFGF